MKRLKYWFFLLIVFIILLAGGYSLPPSDDSVKPVAGVLDLSGQDFAADGNIVLDGPWEFYWEKLLYYDDLNREKPDLYATVPHTWEKYALNGTKLSGQGYATYRLHVKTALPAGTQLGLWINNFSSAYRLYINENLLASNGRVAAEAAKETGEYKTQAVFFNLPASQFDIIIQVSNFHYARGGFWYSIALGNSANIFKLYNYKLINTAMLLGALIIVSLFYFSQSLLRKELKYTIYFALLCLCVGLFFDSMSYNLLARLLPGLSLNAVIFIWYSAGVWMMFFLTAFMHELFKSKLSSVIFRATLVLSIALQLLYIFTSPLQYTQYLEVGSVSVVAANILYLLEFICNTLIVAIGIKNGKKDGWLNLFGLFILIFTFVYDNLFFLHVRNSSSGEIFNLGAFLFLLIQMYIQAKRIKEYHEQKTSAELAFLQAQIKPHFLYNSLNTFISVSLYDVDKARDLLVNFSEYLRRSFDLKGSNQFALLKDEVTLVKAYLDIEQARFGERLEVSLILPDDLAVKVPVCMLQPVAENAVVHGLLPKLEGGRVEIKIVKEGRLMRFSVKDNGVGMSPRQLERIMNPGKPSGIGLGNISQRLRTLYNKELHIKSTAGQGSEVSWEIPVK